MNINNFSRRDIQEEYVDYLVGSMDFIEARTALKDCINKEKSKLTNSQLEKEIRESYPRVLYEYYTEDSTAVLEGGY
jgi:hypothetical protein